MKVNKSNLVQWLLIALALSILKMIKIGRPEKDFVGFEIIVLYK